MDRKDRESTWDWVTARHACSLEAFFERLYLGTVKNVEVRLAQAQADRQRLPLVVQQVDSTLFSVTRPLTAARSAAVRFKRSATEIRVEGMEVAVNVRGTVTMNDDGHCRLLVDGQELDEWQVLKRAFESLFFDDLDGRSAVNVPPWAKT